MIDKNPFHTGTLLLMAVISLEIVYGVVFLILRNKK
jgi:hypothetical protein